MRLGPVTSGMGRRLAYLSWFTLSSVACMGADESAEWASRIDDVVRNGRDTRPLQQQVEEEGVDMWPIVELLAMEGHGDSVQTAIKLCANGERERIGAYAEHRIEELKRLNVAACASTLDAARGARYHDKPALAVSLLRPVAKDVMSVLDVQVQLELALALRDLGDLEGSLRSRLRAAQGAQTIGWAAAAKTCLTEVVWNRFGAAVDGGAWWITDSVLLCIQRRLRDGYAVLLTDIVLGHVVEVLVTCTRITYWLVGTEEWVGERSRAILRGDSRAAVELGTAFLGQFEEWLKSGICVTVATSGGLGEIPFCMLRPAIRWRYTPLLMASRVRRSTGTGRGVLECGTGEAPAAGEARTNGGVTRVDSVVPLPVELLQHGAWRLTLLGRQVRPDLVAKGEMGDTRRRLASLYSQPEWRSDLCVLVDSECPSVDMGSPLSWAPSESDVMNGDPRAEGELEELHDRIVKEQLRMRFLVDEACPRVIRCLWPIDKESRRLYIEEVRRLWTSPSDGRTEDELLWGVEDAIRNRLGSNEPRRWAGWQVWVLPD